MTYSNTTKPPRLLVGVIITQGYTPSPRPTSRREKKKFRPQRFMLHRVRSMIISGCMVGEGIGTANGFGPSYAYKSQSPTCQVARVAGVHVSPLARLSTGRPTASGIRKLVRLGVCIVHTEKVTGDLKTWWGKKLTELKLKDGSLNTVAKMDIVTEFSGFGPEKDGATDSYTESDWDAAYDELMADKDAKPSKAEIVTFVNNKLRQQARLKEIGIQVAAAGLVQPTLETDTTMQLKRVYDTLIVAINKKTGVKHTHEEARAKAAEFLELEWPN